MKELKELKLLVKQRNFGYRYDGNASMAQLPSYLFIIKNGISCHSRLSGILLNGILQKKAEIRKIPGKPE